MGRVLRPFPKYQQLRYKTSVQWRNLEPTEGKWLPLVHVEETHSYQRRRQV